MFDSQIKIIYPAGLRYGGRVLAIDSQGYFLDSEIMLDYRINTPVE